VTGSGHFPITSYIEIASCLGEYCSRRGKKEDADKSQKCMPSHHVLTAKWILKLQSGRRSYLRACDWLLRHCLEQGPPRMQRLLFQSSCPERKLLPTVAASAGRAV
jgi:hypothetical protein